jgi:aspartokinase
MYIRTGMAGVPGTASAIFGAVKDVGANVVMISQVYVVLLSSLSV